MHAFRKYLNRIVLNSYLSIHLQVKNCIELSSLFMFLYFSPGLYTREQNRRRVLFCSLYSGWHEELVCKWQLSNSFSCSYQLYSWKAISKQVWYCYVVPVQRFKTSFLWFHSMCQKYSILFPFRIFLDILKWLGQYMLVFLIKTIEFL